MVPDPLVKTLGATVVNNVITPGQGVAVEATITAVLLLVVGAVTDPDRNDLANAAPIAIGIAITCCHIFAVSIDDYFVRLAILICLTIFDHLIQSFPSTRNIKLPVKLNLPILGQVRNISEE